MHAGELVERLHAAETVTSDDHPANPLGGLYRTMAILVIDTVVRFYTIAHLTALTALEQMDPELEAVSASLDQLVYKTFWRNGVGRPPCRRSSSCGCPAASWPRWR
jgi:hypothetical protein